MKLNCPKCAAEITAVNMNLERMVAKCATCYSVFSFADHVGAAKLARKLDVPQPEKVKLKEWGDGLTLHWHWFTWQILLLTIFAIFWNGIILGGFGSAIVSGTDNIFHLLPLLILPHFWIGLVMAYYTITGYVNKTTVTVDHNQLTVRHTPLPWWGNKRVDTSEIVQLYTKHNLSRYRRGNNWSGNFEVHAILKKGKHQKLLSGLESSEHVLFVEQTIEDYLGIEDYVVRGEYGR
ncbi:MAG: hypothetical protein GY805_30315 [Chloroflexi bacterium]|nr:hypothetical protein [Chloroflexota bacterium]